MDETELFELLENIRLEKGMNITDFAMLLNMSHETYYKCKRGEPPKIFIACSKLINFLKEEHRL